MSLFETKIIPKAINGIEAEDFQKYLDSNATRRTAITSRLTQILKSAPVDLVELEEVQELLADLDKSDKEIYTQMGIVK